MPPKKRSQLNFTPAASRTSRCGHGQHGGGVGSLFCLSAWSLRQPANARACVMGSQRFAAMYSRKDYRPLTTTEFNQARLYNGGECNRIARRECVGWGARMGKRGEGVRNGIWGRDFPCYPLPFVGEAKREEGWMCCLDALDFEG